MTAPVIPRYQSSGGDTLIAEEITSNSVAQTGYLYYANSPSLLTIQLPPLAIDQDRWSLINSGTATVRVSQAAGQVVVVGDTSTTAGVTGRITSYTQGDWIEFYYVSNKWYAEIKVGFVEVD